MMLLPSLRGREAAVAIQPLPLSQSFPETVTRGPVAPVSLPRKKTRGGNPLARHPSCDLLKTQKEQIRAARVSKRGIVIARPRSGRGNPLRIPSKTFFLGEYAALCGYPAILLTGPPYFEVSSLRDKVLEGVHPDSPAAHFWRAHCQEGLRFSDPHQGKGGMGASSAQFLAVYRQYCEEQGRAFLLPELLEAYFECAWSQKGIKPSGYDVLAQTREGFSYIQQDAQIEALTWPFQDINYRLLHTENKCATHTYLESLEKMPSVEKLYSLTQKAYQAFKSGKSSDLIEAICDYHQAMLAFGWVAPHTQALIEKLQKEPGVLALKGCGAMGSDVVLKIF